MKLLRAFVATESILPVLSALREAGGRPLVLPAEDPRTSADESLLSALVSDARDPGRFVRVQAICDDDAADRSMAAVSSAAQTARSPSVVLITPWS